MDNEKNILVITADYHPYPSSTTNCFEPYLFALENKGWHIDIVTRRLSLASPTHEKCLNNADVYRIDDVRTINTLKVNKRTSNAQSPFKKLIMKAVGLFSKTLYYMRYCLFTLEPRFAGWDKKAVIDKYLLLHEQKEYSSIISVSYPVMTHEIAIEVVEKSRVRPKWLWLEFDAFCYNEAVYGKNCYKRLFPIQCKMYEKCDKILTSPALYNLYNNGDLHKFMSKMAKVPFANMKEIEVDVQNVHGVELPSGKINCVYGGALREDIRHPGVVLEVFSKHVSDTIHLTMMSGSNLTFLKEQLKQTAGRVTVTGGQPREVAYKTMMNADVLISIGNAISFQTPGKIFEYMAMGKPIIHFSKTEDDPCLAYFENYPMVLIIEEYDSDYAAHGKTINSFCEKYKDVTLSFDKVQKYIPELTSEKATQEFLRVFDELTEKVQGRTR